ncbi:hypothetical protein GQ457_13G014210 [Hibiscus cannabinus]
MQGHQREALAPIFQFFGLGFRDSHPSIAKMGLKIRFPRHRSPNPTVRSIRFRDMSFFSPKETFSPLGFVVGAPHCRRSW